MAINPYESTDLAELILRRYYPERTSLESAIIRDFLLAHGAEYDRYEFSVRVGEGVTPDPAHLPGVQRATAFNTKKRIDLILWKQSIPTIVEVKQRIGPSVLGQLRTYLHLYVSEHPDVRTAALAAVGRYSDPDTLRVLAAEGIDVYLYEPADATGSDAASSV